MAHPAALPTPSRPVAVNPPAAPTVPLRQLAPFLVFGGLLAMLALFFIGVEQGAISLVGGHYVHELVHDARHLLAFPCH